MADPETWILDRQRSAEVIHADLTEQTYRLLRDSILRRQIEAGAKVSIDAIADQVGVSRTPVTDALKRLAADGLVEIIPRRGTFVRGITSRGAAEMFDVRLMIELYAAESALASGRGAVAVSSMDAPMAGMEAAGVTGTYDDYESFIDNDRLFHRAIVSTLENDQLLRMYDEINFHMYVARAHYIQTVEAAKEAQAEHKAIHTAFVAGDSDRVKAALAAHINGVRNRIVSIIDREGGLI
jgi:DNA-binding GntR family transcriptional regulator